LVPGSDDGSRPLEESFDHLVGEGEDRWRDHQSERLRGLQVGHKLEGRRLLDGQVGGLRSLEDPIDEVGFQPASSSRQFSRTTLAIWSRSSDKTKVAG
jgi:hypothetical protein